MPGRILSQRAATAVVAEETSEVFLVLVKIEHEDLDKPIRVVNNLLPITRTEGDVEVEYIALPFEIELPDEGDRPGDARLAVSNVDRKIVEALRSIQTRPDVEIRVVLASQPDIVELELTGLKLGDATYDAGVVQGYLRYEDLAVEPVADSLTPSRFPALF